MLKNSKIDVNLVFNTHQDCGDAGNNLPDIAEQSSNTQTGTKILDYIMLSKKFMKALLLKY